MISTRYVPATLVLVGLCIVPTLIHSYAPQIDTDGRSASSVGTALAGYTGTDSGRNPTWGDRHFGSHDWMERTYRTETDEVRLTVVTSFDAKSLYHHPELAVAYGADFVGERTRALASRPDVIVHVLQPGPGSRAVGMYALHYGDRFIDDPIRFQIRSAVEMLFSRRQPLTLFFVFDQSAPDVDDLETLGATKVLLAAVDSFAQGKDAAR